MWTITVWSVRCSVCHNCFPWKIVFPPPPRVESTTGLLGKSNFKLALNRIHRNRKCRRMVHSQFVEEKTVRKISIFHSIYFEFARWSATWLKTRSFRRLPNCETHSNSSSYRNKKPKTFNSKVNSGENCVAWSQEQNQLTKPTCVLNQTQQKKIYRILMNRCRMCV